MLPLSTPMFPNLVLLSGPHIPPGLVWIWAKQKCGLQRETDTHTHTHTDTSKYCHHRTSGLAVRKCYTEVAAQAYIIRSPSWTFAVVKLGMVWSGLAIIILSKSTIPTLNFVWLCSLGIGLVPVLLLGWVEQYLLIIMVFLMLIMISKIIIFKLEFSWHSQKYILIVVEILADCRL